MSKALALVVVLFFMLFCEICYGELRVGFYEGKCGLTNVEGVVQNVVNTWHIEKKEKDIPAALLRMQFHDCFVNVRNLHIELLLFQYILFISPPLRYYQSQIQDFKSR